jgi:hypothetical protein
VTNFQDVEDDRAADGLAHLQAAAREAIAAARAFLDVAEEIVGDPKAVSSIVDAVGSVVRTAADRARAATGANPDDPDDGSGAGRVQHIRIS